MSLSAKTNLKTQNLTLAALLTAFGIFIPMVMPVKLIIGPSSFTLASHVPIFLAMFISPSVAIMVTLGSTAGFFLAGFNYLIVARALSHLIFASLGAFFIKNRPNLLQTRGQKYLFSFLINVIHALSEVAIVYALTAADSTKSDYWYILLVLVGLGTLIHGMVDFVIASYTWHLTQKVRR